MADVRPYLRLGSFIAQKRAAASMPNQSDLARAVGYSQQAVSRWEKGRSRPKSEQLATLAAALRVKPEVLSELAGYAPPEAIATTVALPVERLTPEAFEQLVEHILALKYPEAKVSRVGKSGHAQSGTDVLARLPSGEVISVQCKRVAQFGPEYVRKAVRDHDVKADRKILALSRVASPLAAEVLAEHDDWELWDANKLTQIFRLELSKDQQDRVVDNFFRGQRRSLTGRTEAGPWQTAQEFFGPFVGRGTIFSHDLELVGREDAISALEQHLASDTRLVFLSAGGGMGKSRVLKEAIARVEANDPHRMVRFLSPTADFTRASVEALGPFPKVLVIDDAHDRDGLGGLIGFAADPVNNVQLLISTRPYAEARIRREAAVYSIESPPVVKLDRFSRSELKELAAKALAERGAPEEWVDPVVVAANDSPLVVVMAARLVAKDGRAFERAKSADELRDNILGRFERVITGDLGLPGDEVRLQDLLRVLALIQPFHHADPGLLAFIETTVGIRPDAASRLIRVLVEGGVVYQRGTQYRLMPDLLGDYILESSCVTHNGQLAPFAVRAWEAARPNQIVSILQNLGRLDWRRSDGTTADSKFLEPLWRDLEKVVTTDYDDRLNAIRSVAVFQPLQALRFVEAKLHSDLDVGALTNILRAITYSSEYLDEVCEILWELGRNDTRDTNPHPNHPLRVLQELGQFEIHKPLAINRRVLDFGLKLVERPDAWGGRFTPLDVLEPFLGTEGTTTESRGRSFAIGSFFVDREAVGSLRQQVVDRIIGLLHHADPFISFQAGQKLQEAVRFPMGLMGAEAPEGYLEGYRAEFTQTLERIRKAIKERPLPLMTPIALSESMAWLAVHGKGALAKKAQAIVDLEPRDLAFRLRAALVDGWGHTFRRGHADVRKWDIEFQEALGNLADDLCNAYPDAEALRRELELALADIKQVRASDNSAHILVSSLLKKHPALASVLLSDAMSHPESATATFAAGALQILLDRDPASVRPLTRELVKAGDQKIRIAGIRAYYAVTPNEADLGFFAEVLASPDKTLVFEVLGLLFRSDLPQRTKIDLTRRVRFDGNVRIADEVALIWRDINRKDDDSLDEEDARYFLDQARPLLKLEGHWINELLAIFSERFPMLTIRFFTDRVSAASKRENLDIRPINYGPYAHTPLRFADGPHAGEIFQYLWRWLSEQPQGGYFTYHVAHLFKAVFRRSLEPIISHFDSALGHSGENELRLMAVVLREAYRNLVFDNRDFVVRYLDRCKAVDKELTDDALSALYASAASGSKSGAMGEPMPEDLAMKEGATEALKHVPRLSAAYKLYAWLLQEAEREIARARAEGAALDDEE